MLFLIDLWGQPGDTAVAYCLPPAAGAITDHAQPQGMQDAPRTLIISNIHRVLKPGQHVREKKNRATDSHQSRGCELVDCRLGESQREQCSLVDCGGDGETAVGLVTFNGQAGHWPENAIGRPAIVAVVGERSLHLDGHLAWRGIAVTKDRAVINVGAIIGIVAVGREPPAIVPEPVTAAVANEAVVLRAPPAAIMPLTPIEPAGIAKRHVIATDDKATLSSPAGTH